MAITREVSYSGDYEEEAARRRAAGLGRTDLYQTGLRELDDYMHGGYGRDGQYELMVIYGPTGIGKSTVALNFLGDPIRRGVKVGLLVLEDDMPDVNNRLHAILGEDAYKTMNENETVRCIPADALEKSWNLDDLLAYIEQWFTEDFYGVDVILLDHLQFAFEGAESIKGENEYIAQRIFMKKLNRLTRKVGKTLIVVSHTNKGKNVGMDKIVGSGAIAQAGTKVIEVAESDLQQGIQIFMRKSRFTETPRNPLEIKLVDGKLHRGYYE